MGALSSPHRQEIFPCLEKTRYSRGAVESRDGVAVVLGVGEELQEVVADHHTSGYITGSHACRRVMKEGS